MHREVTELVDDYIDHFNTRKPLVQMADLTFGGGNHSIPLLLRHPNLRILGLDLDTKLLEHCALEYHQLLEKKRLALKNINFAAITTVN